MEKEVPRIKIWKNKESKEIYISKLGMEKELESANILTSILIHDTSTFVFRGATYEATFPDVKETILESVEIGGSVIALDVESEEIVGICVGREYSDKYSNIEYIERIEEKYKERGRPRYVMEMWRKYLPIFKEQSFSASTKVFNIEYIGVIPKYYGYGLGALLLTFCIERARQLQFDICSYEAANLFSSNLALQLGFQRQCAVQFDTYSEELVDADGNKTMVFPMRGTNQMVAHMVKERTGKIVLNPATEMVILILKL